jgi:oligosaccharide repeat unit polymerase
MKNKRVAWYLIPSSYGFCIWAVLLTLVNLTVVRVQLEAFALFFYVVICFAFSNFLNGRIFSKVDFASLSHETRIKKIDENLFYLSAAIGFFGLFLYARDFGAELGGTAVFFYTFFESPLQIRGLAQEVTSSGFQISYFSWIFIFYGAYFIFSGFFEKKYSILLVWILLFLAFFLNLLFIDRTRPITIFVVSALTVIFLRLHKIRRPSRLIFFLLLSPFIIFLAQAIFTQKYDAEEGLFGNIVVYIFGGFGYLSALLYDVSPQYELTRTFLPISKILESFGVIRNVPSQVLEFKDVPFPTNVGTFLEPMLSDGGAIFVVLLTPLLIFWIDYFALKTLASRTVLGVFLWANLVFLQMLSFFVPKYNATYLYLFAIIFILSKIFKFGISFRRR